MNEGRRTRRRHGRDEALRQRVSGRRLLSVDEAERIAEMIDAEALAPEIVKAVASAPRGERDVLALVVHDQIRPSEAARILGITPEAARTRLSRVRKRVRAATAAVSPSRLSPARTEMEE